MSQPGVSKKHPPTAWVNATLAVAKRKEKGALLWISEETPLIIIVEKQKKHSTLKRQRQLHDVQLFLIEVKLQIWVLRPASFL